MCRVIEHAIIVLCEMIKNGEAAPGDENPNERSKFRRRMVTVIHTLPLCSRALLAEARQHAGFEPVLMYERVRCGIHNRSYFLDGIPLSMALFAGDTSITLNVEDLQKLKLRDLMADRLQTVAKLEKMPPSLPRKMELIANNHPEDMSDQVPGPVRVLVSRCRAMCKGIRTVRPASSFAYCSNCNCPHLLRGRRQRVLEQRRVAPGGKDPDVSDEEEDYNSNAYWEAATCDRSVAEPSVRRFCSSACHEEFESHMDAMMPDRGLHLDADNGASKQGRARVAESFRLVLKRNEIAARALRTMRSKPRTHLAVSREEMDLHIERRITALNVDLGVLYASKLIAESGRCPRASTCQAVRHVLARQPGVYARMLKQVSAIYAGMRRKEGIVSSLLTMPRFIEAINSKAHRMV